MNSPKAWMFWTMILAGVYNILWGAYVIFFPSFSFTVLGATPPAYPQLWQCIGMIVGVYGLGYIISASSPIRHWPIILVGLLGKIFGPIGFIQALYQGVFPLSFGINIIFNDLIWWIPFTLILKEAYQFHTSESTGEENLDSSLAPYIESGKLTAEDLEQKHAIIALRHHGCTFTRELLHDLGEQIQEFKRHKIKIILVHMDDSGEFNNLAQKYLGSDGWIDLPDPTRKVYRALGLKLGSIGQVFGLKVWIRGTLGILKGFGLGPLRGHGLQLSGLLIRDARKTTVQYQTQSAADRIPFNDLILKSLRST
jgi:hypothetical protein